MLLVVGPGNAGTRFQKDIARSGFNEQVLLLNRSAAGLGKGPGQWLGDSVVIDRPAPNGVFTRGKTG